MTIVIDLPFPVSVNRMYRNVRGRGRVKTKDYVAWNLHAGLLLNQQRPVNQQRPAKIIGRYHMDLQLGRPDRRHRDASNYIKGVGDLLVRHGVVEDDRYEQSVTVRWVDGLTGCRVVITGVDA